MAVLEARGVHFSYRRDEVLSGVALAVEAGEIVALVGPNGAGKSTLLRIFSGLLAPQRGEVRLFGRPLGHYGRRELAREVAFVEQAPGVEFPFTVAEVVLMARAPHLGRRFFENRRDLRAAEEALRLVGLLSLADRPVHELSGGERQRVFLARALAQETPVLLLDEPTTFLDVRHQLELYEVLRRLAADGRTIVVALHDLQLASACSTKMALLSGGHLVAAGSPDEVLTRENLRAAYGVGVNLVFDEQSRSYGVFPYRG
ncbi:MAG: histidinol-phosphatase [Candidatus Binatia bacterium]|nr:MAG: histidinol-phosphatase [Candidatus Binatia bacterium]